MNTISLDLDRKSPDSFVDGLINSFPEWEEYKSSMIDTLSFTLDQYKKAYKGKWSYDTLHSSYMNLGLCNYFGYLHRNIIPLDNKYPFIQDPYSLKIIFISSGFDIDRKEYFCKTPLAFPDQPNMHVYTILPRINLLKRMVYNLKHMTLKQYAYYLYLRILNGDTIPYTITISKLLKIKINLLYNI